MVGNVSAKLDIMPLTVYVLRFVEMAFYSYLLVMMEIMKMVTDALHFVLSSLIINVLEETQIIVQNAFMS